MLLRFVAVAVLTAALMPSAASAAEICLSDWAAAGEIVRSKGLKTVEQLTRTQAQQLNGQIVKATLCEDKGSYVYRLVVRDGAGQLKNVVMGASNYTASSNSP